MVRTTKGPAEKSKPAKTKTPAPVVEPTPEPTPEPTQPTQTPASDPGGAYHSGMANDPSLKS